MDSHTPIILSSCFPLGDIAMLPTVRPAEGKGQQTGAAGTTKNEDVSVAIVRMVGICVSILFRSILLPHHPRFYSNIELMVGRWRGAKGVNSKER